MSSFIVKFMIRMTILAAVLGPWFVWLDYLQAQTGRRIAVVPFVGCRSDGQAGPIDPPEGSNVALAISVREAEHLAYYKSAQTIGVLAPRGWHCAATYGSGGDTLHVVPEHIDPKDMFSSQRQKITGAAIQVSRRYGDTSGRYSVAEVIARMFPAYKSFVENVIETFDLPSNSFPHGPYPTDTIRYRGETVAEYRTPPEKEGLGTYSWLAKSDRPINGAAILVGSAPDLLILAVRLPDSMESLTSTIVARFEQDAASQIP